MNAVYKGNDKYYFRCICCEDGYEKTGSLSIDSKSSKKIDIILLTAIFTLL